MVVVTEEGDFLSVPVTSPPPGLGETIEVPDYQAPGFPRRRWLVTAAALLVLLLSISLVRPLLLPQAVAAVSLDLSSGLEIQVDGQNRVTKVKALQREGEELVSHLDLQGESIYTAVNKVMVLAQGQGYLQTGEEDTIMVTVIPLKGRGRLGLDSNQLQQAMVAELERHHFQGYLVVQRTEKDHWREAGKMGLSVGRYLLGERAKAGGNVIDLEDLKEKPVMKLLGGNEENLETIFPGMWCRVGKGHGPKRGMSAGGGRQASGLGQGSPDIENSSAGSDTTNFDPPCPMPSVPSVRHRGGH